MKMKVCESYPMEWILYCKISISDLLYESTLYFVKLMGFLVTFQRNSESNVNLYTMI